ncbi:hypothetical protein FJ543_14230 [Mesorhizobium sp. B2-5-7]|nr:hypothetical protein FJ543_14230 [Mesorhizobium sp. B2-5-7]
MPVPGDRPGRGNRCRRSDASPIFHDPALAVREAVNGGGVALADNIMVEDLLASGQLVAPFTIRHAIPQSYCLWQKPGNRISIRVRLFRDWLLSEIASHKQVMRLARASNTGEAPQFPAE